MIDTKIIGSGSSGNCYLADFSGTQILLECGLPFKVIQKALNFKLSSIDACLVTHEHIDHSKAVKDLIKNSINVYATKGTFDALNIASHRAKILQKNNDTEYKTVILNDLVVKPFYSIHDAKEPVSFYVKNLKTKESLLFVTDTAYMPYKIPNVDILMVECNYVKSVIDGNVKNDSLNINLRNRIVKNHMSLETLLTALKQANLSNLKKIYVLHLSDANSEEKVILEAIQRQTGTIVEIC
ncbi:MBL fold metallo-hydrolase [Parvimonas micra]